MARPGPTNEQIATALRETHGMVYVAATRIPCSPTTIKSRLKSSAMLREVVESAKGMLLDKAELKLEEQIMAGEPWAIQFYLKTQGKSRGYVERLEQTGRDGDALTIRVVYGDDGTHG